MVTGGKANQISTYNSPVIEVLEVLITDYEIISSVSVYYDSSSRNFINSKTGDSSR